MIVRAVLAVAVSIAAAFAHAQPTGEPTFELALVSLTGEREIVGTLPDTVFAPRVSPNGARMAIEHVDLDERTSSIAVASLGDLDERYVLPLYDGFNNWAPSWSPDGERILFIASGPDGDRIWWQLADGSGGGEHLLDARAAESWANGGEAITYLTLAETPGGRDYGIAMLDIASGETQTIADRQGSSEHSSNVSFDGRFIAYATNESGRYEVFVEPLPQTGERVQITTDGGGHPLWSRDGRTIYFDRDARMYRIGFDPAAGRASGMAEVLPIEGFVQGEYRRQFELMPDGRRFLMLFPLAR
jgi:dipeptidyl aminopeptidase/acylaminoacyl peptidase